jgi:hypothetical protein
MKGLAGKLVNSPGPEEPALDCFQKGFITLLPLECLKCSKVPLRLRSGPSAKMPKVNEISVCLKIDLAKGELLNIRSLKTRSVGKVKARNFWSGPGNQVFNFKIIRFRFP